MEAPDPYREYLAALRAQGLPARDARILVGCARSTPAPRPEDGALLPFLRSRVPGREWALLLDTVAATQARGPRREPFATAWRMLYVAGCPIEHLWRVLWHALRDPGADPQDEAWMPRAAGLANVRRYAALGFPTSGAADTYGPGLGCERLVENTRQGTRRLLELGAPAILAVQAFERCRAVLSPGLRAEVDAVAVTDPASCAAWLDALDAAMARAVHDPGGDRYRLASEPPTVTLPRRRRAPGPPRAVDPDVARLLARWRRKRPWNGTTAGELERTDPLQWLNLVAWMTIPPPIPWSAP